MVIIVQGYTGAATSRLMMLSMPMPKLPGQRCGRHLVATTNYTTDSRARAKTRQKRLEKTKSYCPQAPHPLSVPTVYSHCAAFTHGTHAAIPPCCLRYQPPKKCNDTRPAVRLPSRAPHCIVCSQPHSNACSTTRYWIAASRNCCTATHNTSHAAANTAL